MTKFNRDGFVLMAPGGQLTWDSMVSAHSGKRVSPGGVLVPVPDADGLFVRLLPREARQLTDVEREAVFERARTWAGGLAGPHLEIFPDDAPYDAVLDTTIPREVKTTASDILDEKTVEELRVLARELGIDGRSAMNRGELLEAFDALPLSEVLDALDTLRAQDEETAP